MHRLIERILSNFPDDSSYREQVYRLLRLNGALFAPAVGVLVWLVVETERPLNKERLLLFAMAFGLHLLFAWLDLSNVLDGAVAQASGSHGRFATWSAVLLLGPVALWIDLVGLLVRQLVFWWRKRPAGAYAVRQYWLFGKQLQVTLLRDTLPSLSVIFLWRQWGGAFPLVSVSSANLLSVAGMTLVRMGVALLMLTAIFAMMRYGRSDSRLETGRAYLKFGLALLLFYVLPEPFALLAADIYGAAGIWGFFTYWVGLYLLSLFAHRINKTAVYAQQHAQALYQLEQLAQDILREPVEDTSLPPLLVRHVPQMFQDGWVEIRQLPDQILFAQGEGWLPASESVWERAAAGNEPLILPGYPDAAGFGYGTDALLIPIQNESELIGGIYLMRLLPQNVREWEQAGRSLAAQIGAGLQRSSQFEAALASQAAAYEEAVYEQAYQAEVYAQALAYEKMSQELAAAGRIQTTFLPQELPHLSGWQLAVTLEPARETSGDFYDFIPLPKGRLGLIVADVADKGMGSALYMALSRTLIRTFAAEFASAPEQVLRATNQRILRDTTSDLFVTVFYGILEPETGLLTYCNAGHNPPYLQSRNGEPERLLTRTALPVGLFEDMPWTQESVKILPGDLLVMYTDGVVEAEDEAEAYFGASRLQAITRANLVRSAEVIEDKVVTAVYDFVGDAPQLDDITLMLLMREPD